jgi:hypothetical protein
MKPDRIQKFFSDLYRDVSDRRLLLPLIGLAVAIVTVPMLLSTSAEPVPTSTAPPVDVGDATAVDAAVTLTDTGIRNYRERLEDLKSKNPFDQQYDSETAEQTGTGEVTGSGLDTGTITGSPSDTTDDGTGGSSSASIDVTSTGPPAGAGSPGTTPPSTTPGGEPPEVETSIRFFADRVDVKVGPIGDTKIVRDVRHLDFLPDDRTPIVAFLGLAGGPDHAMFSINPAVIETGGEGSCAPKEQDGCQYLTLGIGEERYFKYGFGQDAETYRLKLLDTHIVRVPDPRDDHGNDGSDDESGDE